MVSPFVGLLLERAARQPEALALVEPGGARWTWRALAASVMAVAGGLAARGLGPGHRVGLRLPNGAPWVQAALGSWAAGATLVPLQPGWGREVQATVEAAADLQLVVGDGGCAVESLQGDSALPAPRACGAPAAIFFTSGSTGPPKGVMHGHGALLACARAVTAALAPRPTDRLLAWLPLGYHYGFTQLGQALCAGAGLAFTRAALPADALADAHSSGATVLAATSSSWPALTAALEADAALCPGLRTFTSAGGHLPGAARRRLLEARPGAALHVFYGFTEALRATWLPPALALVHPEAMGRALPGVRLAVVDAEGRALAPGQPGALVQGGDFVAMGLFGDAAASAAAFARVAALGAGPAARSGDEVVVDGEGMFTFVQRADGVLKVMGHRVGPGEVEAAARAWPGVEDALVLGLPDPVRGEVVGLVLRADAPLDLPGLRRHLRARRSPWEQPRVVLALPEWPLTATGKPDRVALRRLLERA